jgi:methionyl-tRNA formyltransferase
MSAAPLDLVFMGSDPIALPVLNWLAGEGGDVARVTAVFTQPDRAVGRGQKIASNAIKTWALEHGLPVFQPEKLTGEVRGQLGALAADAALVMAYGHILRDDFIATPRLGTLNLHVSLLPKYRGASPIQAAIASGERETGVSLMRIVRQLDAGPVADVQRVPIAPLDTAQEIETALAVASVPLVARALPRLRDGTLTFRPQDDLAASYCRRLEKDDGALDFSAPARTLAARINGLFPWPGCALVVQDQTVKLGLADALAQPQGDRRGPGEVLGADAEGLLVATGDGVLRVRRLQRQGGRMLAAVEFLRGWPVPVGTMLSSRAMSQLVKS